MHWLGQTVKNHWFWINRSVIAMVCDRKSIMNSEMTKVRTWLRCNTELAATLNWLPYWLLEDTRHSDWLMDHLLPNPYSDCSDFSSPGDYADYLDSTCVPIFERRMPSNERRMPSNPINELYSLSSGGEFGSIMKWLLWLERLESAM